MQSDSAKGHLEPSGDATTPKKTSTTHKNVYYSKILMRITKNILKKYLSEVETMRALKFKYIVEL